MRRPGFGSGADPAAPLGRTRRQRGADPAARFGTDKVPPPNRQSVGSVWGGGGVFYVLKPSPYFECVREGLSLATASRSLRSLDLKKATKTVKPIHHQVTATPPRPDRCVRDTGFSIDQGIRALNQQFPPPANVFRIEKWAKPQGMMFSFKNFIEWGLVQREGRYLVVLKVTSTGVWLHVVVIDFWYGVLLDSGQDGVVKINGDADALLRYTGCVRLEKAYLLKVKRERAHETMYTM